MLELLKHTLMPVRLCNDFLLLYHTKRNVRKTKGISNRQYQEVMAEQEIKKGSRNVLFNWGI